MHMQIPKSQKPHYIFVIYYVGVNLGPYPIFIELLLRWGDQYSFLSALPRGCLFQQKC